MENTELDMQVVTLTNQKDEHKIDQFIKTYEPFIIKTISDIKSEYININNDEEFSIGLNAFYEAMNRYAKDKGHFLSFTKLVIGSRLKNYWKKEDKERHTYLEDIENNHSNIQFHRKEKDLKDEIISFEKELNKFGINFEYLVNCAPKHKDTRSSVTEIAIKTSNEEDLLDHLYKKKRLPITKMAERFFVSVKVIKRNKKFIIAVILININEFAGLSEWIKIDKS